MKSMCAHDRSFAFQVATEHTCMSWGAELEAQGKSEEQINEIMGAAGEDPNVENILTMWAELDKQGKNEDEILDALMRRFVGHPLMWRSDSPHAVAQGWVKGEKER